MEPGHIAQHGCGSEASTPKSDNGFASRSRSRRGSNSQDWSQGSELAENTTSKAAWRSFELFCGLSEDDLAKCLSLSKMKVRKFKSGETFPRDLRAPPCK